MTEFAPLSLTSTAAPATPEELTALVRDALHNGTPLYPVGGATSLNYGLPPKQPGIGVVLTGLDRVIDFPARDLTVTVEAGIAMQALSERLAQEGLQLPIDVPRPDAATLGGVIATAWSGPRRYGHGSIRDFVIGIRAIDGRGEIFNGGGRVVKNVAGYDFCKLLTGSLGTLGIITQVTLKLRPIPQQSALVSMATPNENVVERLLSDLAGSDISAVAIELQVKNNQYDLAVALEGTLPEVDWLVEQLCNLGTRHSVTAEVTRGDAANDLLRTYTNFPAEQAPLMLKASVKPSALTRFIAGVRETDLQAVLQISAGSGIAYIKFAEFPKAGLSRTLVGKLQPLAAECGGHVVILANPTGQEVTLQSTFGTLGMQAELMQSVKRQFDPRSILNPGRFVFG